MNSTAWIHRWIHNSHILVWIPTYNFTIFFMIWVMPVNLDYEFHTINSYATFHNLWLQICIHVQEKYREIISEIRGYTCTKVPDDIVYLILPSWRSVSWDINSQVTTWEFSLRPLADEPIALHGLSSVCLRCRAVEGVLSGVAEALNQASVHRPHVWVSQLSCRSLAIRVAKLLSQLRVFIRVRLHHCNTVTVTSCSG